LQTCNQVDGENTCCRQLKGPREKFFISFLTVTSEYMANCFTF